MSTDIGAVDTSGIELAPGETLVPGSVQMSDGGGELVAPAAEAPAAEAPSASDAPVEAAPPAPTPDASTDA
jgi:hypothetical protein